MQQISGASHPHGDGFCHRSFMMFDVRRDPHDGTAIGLHLRDDRHLSCPAFMLDFHGDDPISLILQRFSDIRPFHHSLPINRKDGISGRKMLLLRRASGEYGADPRQVRERIITLDLESGNKDQKGKKHIEERAAHDDKQLRPCRPLVEGAWIILILIIHAGDLIESPQRNQTKGIKRLSPFLRNDHRAETDSKLDDLHPRPLRHEEVPALMDDDNDGKDKDRSQYR